MAKKQNTSSKQNKKELRISKSVLVDVVRVLIGIVVLCVLLSVSLDVLNDQFVTKQEELIEDSKKDFGWIVITVGYTLPLIFASVVPVLACVGSRRDAQRKHLIKGLIIAGAAVITFGVLCPMQIKELNDQRKFCEDLEQRVEDEEDFVYPETAPKLGDVTKELERCVKWTAKAALGIAVVGAYQGARYKKLRDGDADDEIPEDELCDDLPDVDWVEGKSTSKNS